MDVSKIPTVLTAEELTDKAFRRASKVSGQGRDAVKRAKSRDAGKVRTATNVLGDALERYERTFPDFDTLDPFQRDLADLVADLDRTRKALGAVNWAKKQVRRLGNEAARRIERAGEVGQVEAERKRAYGRLASVVEQIDEDLHVLNEARDALRKLPAVRLDVPTVVIAGYPNVGKSSFLERVSTAHPTVAEYPFTTKGIQVGHLERDRLTYQLVDTPGLLDRPLEERNDIERQAVLALTHLADAILFLLDPSGTCGYPLEAQEHLLEEVRRSFPEVPLHVVENKADVHRVDAGRPPMSLETGEGVEEALDAVLDLVPREGPWV